MKSSLYIHIPFCTKICYYCDFFKVKTSLFKNFSQISLGLSKAISKEIILYKQKYPNIELKSIFLGGGTPNILENKAFENIVNTIFKQFKISSKLEFSIECNPELITENQLISYKDKAVNRISLGCQTFNNKTLKEIGRQSNSNNIISAYKLLRKLKFENINLDFIFGLVNQKESDYKNDLKKAVHLDPEHLSCYGLTQNTKNLTRKINNKTLKLPSEEKVLEDYNFTMEFLKSKGYHMYEVSNYSKKNYQCIHNLNYWQQNNYLGIGPSACGKINNKRYTNIKNIKNYIALINNQNYPISQTEYLSPKTQIKENIMLSLRMTKGLNIEKLKKLIGNLKLEEQKQYKTLNQKLKSYIKHKLLIQKEKQIYASAKGFCVIDSIIKSLI